MTESHVKKALEIATEAHKHQVRKFSGESYIRHPKRVAEKVKHHGWVYETVALLHDIAEDTDICVGDLRELFPSGVVGAVNSLTRRRNETYYDYIMQILHDPVARVVKIADLEDNMRDLKEGSMKDKYRLAKHILETIGVNHAKSTSR